MTSPVTRRCEKCKEPTPLDEMRGNAQDGYVCHDCIWLELRVLRMKFEHLKTIGLIDQDGQIKPRRRGGAEKKDSVSPPRLRASAVKNSTQKTK